MASKENTDFFLLTSGIRFHAPVRLFIVLHEVYTHASLTAFLTTLFPVFFSISPLLPPPVKAGLSKALRYLCSAAQERDENGTELSSNTLLWFCVHVYEWEVYVPFSHLLALRCRVENGPGRSASVCWDCWPALLPSLKEKEGRVRRQKEKVRGEKKKADRWQAKDFLTVTVGLFILISV